MAFKLVTVEEPAVAVPKMAALALRFVVEARPELKRFVVVAEVPVAFEYVRLVRV